MNNIFINQSKDRLWFFLGFILLTSFVIRVWGIAYGLPYRYHIDETQIIPPSAKLCSGNINMPPNYGGPNIQHFVLCGTDLVLFGIGWVANYWHTPSEFASAYEQNPTSIYLTARLLHAILGSISILLIFLIGKSLWNKRIGILAAIFACFLFLHVRESHFASRDLFSSFLICVTIFFSSRLLKLRSVRDGILGGLFSGLAAGVMWTAGICLITPISAHLFSYSNSRGGAGIRSRASLIGLFKMILMAGVGFIIGYPNLVLRPSVTFDYLKILLNYSNQGELSQFLSDNVPGWLYYIKTLWWGAGPILTIILLCGIIYAIIKHSPEDIILLNFSIPYLIIISVTSNFIGRYLILVLPALIVIGARTLISILEDLKLHSSRYQYMLAAITLIAILPTMISSLRFDFLLTQVDTRTLAKDWIEANIPSGSSIALDWPIHGPPLSSANDVQPRSNSFYNIQIIGGIGLASWKLEDYKQKGFDYLITSSTVSNLILSDPIMDNQRKEFYRELDQGLKKVAEFNYSSGSIKTSFVYDEIYAPAINLWQRDRPGPTLKIYQIEKSNQK